MGKTVSMHNDQIDKTLEQAQYCKDIMEVKCSLTMREIAVFALILSGHFVQTN